MDPGHAPEYIEKLRRVRIEDPRSYPFDPRVVVSPDHVVVYPGTTGHGRKFVHWLLSQGPCDLTVRGEAIGRVVSPSDIYAEEEWDDPDAYLDPTEMPPRTGTVVTIERDREGLLEHVDVHDSGVMSYEQLRPIDDPVKTYRRMSPELLGQWLELVQRLPLDADAPGPDGSYIDPVFVRIESPTRSFGMPKIDADRPAEPYRELMALVIAGPQRYARIVPSCYQACCRFRERDDDVVVVRRRGAAAAAGERRCERCVHRAPRGGDAGRMSRSPRAVDVAPGRAPSEIGTLRALGFSRFSLLLSFLFEALVLSLVGGVIGSVLVLLLSFVSFPVINFQTFSEIVLRFDATPSVFAKTLIFSGFMGVLGGLVPAIRASQVSPVEAMRA